MIPIVSKKKKALHMERSKPKVKMAKKKKKSKKNQLACIYYNKLNYNEDNYLLLHPYKWLTLNEKKTLEAKNLS